MTPCFFAKKVNGLQELGYDIKGMLNYFPTNGTVLEWTLMILNISNSGFNINSGMNAHQFLYTFGPYLKIESLMQGNMSYDRLIQVNCERCFDVGAWNNTNITVNNQQMLCNLTT